jgi:hypothetical protein
MAKEKKELDQNLSYDVWCKFSEHFLLQVLSAALAFSLIQFPTSQSRLSRKLLLVLEKSGGGGRGRLK